MAIERTLAIIKPDAVAAGHVGGIVAMIESAGLRIVGLRMLRLTVEQARAFYAIHAQRPFFEGLVAFMTSGPVVVMALEADDAIAGWRALMGPTDATKAGPDTVRGRFGEDVSRNAVHGSDAAGTAAVEIPFFFPTCQLV